MVYSEQEGLRGASRLRRVVVQRRRRRPQPPHRLEQALDAQETPRGLRLRHVSRLLAVDC